MFAVTKANAGEGDVAGVIDEEATGRAATVDDGVGRSFGSDQLKIGLVGDGQPCCPDTPRQLNSVTGNGVIDGGLQVKVHVRLATADAVGHGEEREV